MVDGRLLVAVWLWFNYWFLLVAMVVADVAGLVDLVVADVAGVAVADCRWFVVISDVVAGVSSCK